MVNEYLQRLYGMIQGQQPMATSPMTSPQLGMLNRILGLSTQQAQTAMQEMPQKLQESRAMLEQFDPNQPIDPRLLDQFMALTGFAPMGIVSPMVAKSLQMSTTLPKDETFTVAVKNTPGAQITDEGLLMRVQRSQKPEQAGEESVRSGVFYLPEGAEQAKYYSTGKSGYGGTEKISGETLYKNPLFVKGATGGKAPEAAYDQLMGKGAYQQMRNEVLNSYLYNAKESQKIEAIQEILQKYNGMDSMDAYDTAYNIVTNSKSANQLPYAVQENIVANAVRNSGHDAVLGFSKKRTGDPFISEVFDVREATYPTKEGGFSLVPQFESLLGP